MKNQPTKQTPRERLIKGNTRVIAPSGRTTWRIKAVDSWVYMVNYDKARMPSKAEFIKNWVK